MSGKEIKFNNTESKKRYRSLNSSNSDLDSSLNTSTETPIKTNKQTKKEKQQEKKKAKMMTEAINESVNTEKDSMSAKIDQINSKLNNMLTKDDTSFIKLIITETLEEMREKIIGTVVKRVEIIESELHEKADENDKLKKEIEQCKSQNILLEQQLKKETDKRIENDNEMEQYSRRNNIRISGLSKDNPTESAQESTEGVLNLLNTKLGLSLNFQDIDIAHRLGRFKPDKKRAVIVKFVHRHVKQNVLRNAHKLKNTSLSINEDLTKINQSVLASLRVKTKGKDTIEKSWSVEGKIYAKYKNNVVKPVKYEEYAKWLAYPWPEEENNIMETTSM